MKQISTLVVALLATAGVFAQTTSDDFNSRTGVTVTQVKGHLQSQCWQFTDFDVNNNGWNPGIEGDGAMVSGPGDNPSENTGIYSQQLSLGGNFTVSFYYRFASAVSDRRWINIYLTDGNNNITDKLDSVELTGASGSTTYHFNQTYNAGSRCYRVYIQYQGIGGNNPIAIDQLSFGAPTCYSSGCNQAPVAVGDNIQGDNTTYQATGWVSLNDYDADANSALSYNMVTNSADGNITLYGNGYFTFTPNPGFKGASTTFTYMTCDNGTPALCSAPATVTVNFLQQSSLPVSIVDLGAAYTDNGVLVKWTTTFEQNNDRFEIERSTDGATFKSVGTVKGQGNSGNRHDYEFNDDVKRNTASKNDLYYRLKQVDLDGKASYSKVLIVRVYQTRALQSVSVTPNPAVNDIRLNVQLNENSYIVTKVINASGIEIMRKNLRGNPGSNNLRLEGTSGLQSGVYFLEVIINSNERMLVKLIKS